MARSGIASQAAARHVHELIGVQTLEGSECLLLGDHAADQHKVLRVVAGRIGIDRHARRVFNICGNDLVMSEALARGMRFSASSIALSG